MVNLASIQPIQLGSTLHRGRHDAPVQRVMQKVIEYKHCAGRDAVVEQRQRIPGACVQVAVDVQVANVQGRCPLPLTPFIELQ